MNAHWSIFKNLIRKIAKCKDKKEENLDFFNKNETEITDVCNLYISVTSDKRLSFKVIFLFQKSTENLLNIFFSSKNIKTGAQILLLTYFHNFNFECTLCPKSVLDF